MKTLSLARRTSALTAVAFIAAMLATGCVYRLNIQQGNVVEQESIEQVEPGMTRSQVQFLLGTPMISDAFHDNRWDYTYYFRRGRDRSIQRRWFIVYFDENDRVARIEHEIVADEESEEELEEELEEEALQEDIEQASGAVPPQGPVQRAM